MPARYSVSTSLGTYAAKLFSVSALIAGLVTAGPCGFGTGGGISGLSPEALSGARALASAVSIASLRFRTARGWLSYVSANDVARLTMLMREGSFHSLIHTFRCTLGLPT